MTPQALERHLSLPTGIGPDGRLLSLAECLSRSEVVSDRAQMSDRQKIDLVEARWRAGEWSDILYGTEGLIGLERAVSELKSGSEIGLRLMAIELRAIEMVMEDAAVATETDR